MKIIKLNVGSSIGPFHVPAGEGETKHETNTELKNNIKQATDEVIKNRKED